MSETIYSQHTPKGQSSEKILVSIKTDDNQRIKVTLDNIVLRLNDDNRSHYEAATANITMGADDLQELIESLQAAKAALEAHRGATI